MVAICKVINTLEQDGIVVNVVKSKWQPAQKISWFGFDIVIGSDSTQLPPCYYCTFVTVDRKHVVLYGGQTEDGNNEDVFILNIHQWV